MHTQPVWVGHICLGIVWLGMDEFGLVWLSSVRFDGVDFLKYSRSASQLSFTNLYRICIIVVLLDCHYRSSGTILKSNGIS